MSDEFDYEAFEKEKEDAPELYQRVIGGHEANFGRSIDQMSMEQRLFALRSFRNAYVAFSILAKDHGDSLMDRLTA